MTPDSGFMGAVEKKLNPKPAPEPKAVYGYKVVSAEEAGLTDWFKQNKHVAGMAMGGGLNGTPKDAPRTVVANPFNKGMKDAGNRAALYTLEAARHVMDEQKYVPQFKLTPEIQKWRSAKFPKDSPYRTDDRAFRETVLSRMLVGDDAPENEEIKRETEAVKKLMEGRAARAESFLLNVNSRVPQ